MANEWDTWTGTLTQLAATFRSLIPRIFLDSSLTFISSEECPPAFSDPAIGITFSAIGTGQRESAWFMPADCKSAATSPDLVPASGSVATAANSFCS